ncbi:DNA helicase [Spirochaetia bacterium]|nr:DNA helicase [Spirochaetia bacterium]
MRVIADLHIHSRFSLATSPRLNPAMLDRWARIKGIALLGSGDCTHPQWLAELREQLVESEEGLYTLKNEIRSAFDAGPALIAGLPRVEHPRMEHSPVRFVLTGEISTIYRQGGRTRKIHHLVILPDFRAAAAFQAKLERVGNIASDGRPILGINSRDLLALLLEADERAVLIPAHIWTPWFSVLGAKSGFDSIEECYGDLTKFIPAIETGLSSNPPMNWALSALDHYNIISNSDAHSPDKLGRESTILEMEFSYASLWTALQSGVAGTMEFFPQGGKYHYDGHRSCGLCLGPEEAVASGGICPVCGKLLTRGVMGRVLELADRPVDEAAPCPENYAGTNRRPYWSLIPLREILAEILETGPASKKIDAAYGSLIEKAGNEFAILVDMPKEELEKFHVSGCSGELLAGAVSRMRAGTVSITPGYDGEYGIVRTMQPGLRGKDELFGEPPPDDKPPKARRGGRRSAPVYPVREEIKRSGALNTEQEAAVSSKGKFGIIIAGPGTGKTSTLAERIAGLIKGGAVPSSILALSFTVKAAGELRERILRSAPGGSEGITTATFHSLCASVLRDMAEYTGLSENFKIITEDERKLVLRKLTGTEAAGSRRVNQAGKYIEMRKQFLLLPGDQKPPFGGATADLVFLAEELGIPPSDNRWEWFYKKYQESLAAENQLDFDDLLTRTARLLAVNRKALSSLQERFRYILVDEYQDVNFSQYALLRLLAPDNGDDQGGPSLWVIGDPNQAIYGFRGSDKRFIDRFTKDYAGAKRFYLSKSFRCAAPLTDAAGRLVGARLEGNDFPVILHRSASLTDKAEAEGIARRIAVLTGGSSFFAIDSKTTISSETVEENTAPGDCAILLRSIGLAAPFVKALKDHGLPFELNGEESWWRDEKLNTLVDFLRCTPFPGLSVTEAVKFAWESISTKGREHYPIPPEAINRLISLSSFFDDIPSLLDALAVSGSGDLPEVKSEGVKIMSIHASKGLEFDHIFVPALEEGILPFTLYGEKETGEERRLLYVAMTRARKGLYLSWAAFRNFKGRILKSPPSHFLAGLETLIPLAENRPYREKDPQLQLF